MTDRAGLADFLRRRREQLRPADVGLPEVRRRRTPGLRREEVAQLAGVSTDHYSRLEQARGSAPSQAVVTALARALRCDLDQHDHLLRLAGFPATPRRSGGHLRPGLIDLASRLGQTDVGVSLCSDLGEVLWHNALFAALTGFQQQRPGRDDNVVWRWFTDPDARRRTPPADWSQRSAASVSELRSTWSRRAGEADVVALVTDLQRSSTEFADLWERHEVTVRRSVHKTVLHPEVGVVELTCEVMLTPEEDVQLQVMSPTEGTDAREKLNLLRVIGTQDFQTAGGATRRTGVSH